MKFLLLAHALVARSGSPHPRLAVRVGSLARPDRLVRGLSLLWREPRLDADDWRPVSERISSLLVNRVTETLAALAGVILFFLVIYSGLHGTDDPARNFLADVRLRHILARHGRAQRRLRRRVQGFNPWRTIARAVSAGFRLVAGQRAPTPFEYPEWLGRWPSVLGVLAFAWLELIYGASGLNRRSQPHVTAVAAIVYSGSPSSAWACSAPRNGSRAPRSSRST